MSQKQLLQKAAIDSIQLADGGKLLGDQADQFIDLTVDFSGLMKIVRVERKNAPTGEIDKLNIGAPVTEKATENTDSGNVYRPDFSKVTFSMVKTRSAFDLTTEAEEDSVEGSRIRSTILGAFAKAMANDDEQLIIEGDSSLSGTDVTSRLLKSYDGLHVISTSCANYVDANGKAASLKLFKAMIKRLPKKYKRIKNQLKWLVPSAVYEDMLETYGARLTPGGDQMYTGTILLRPFGIEMVEIPAIPDDLTIGTASTSGTFIILTAPKNLIYFVQREITVHFWFNARKDTTEVTVYRRTAFEIENLDLMVKGRSIETAEGAALYGA